MTSFLYYVPLFAAVVAILSVALAPLNRELDRLLTRIALLTFDTSVNRDAARHARRKMLLQAAHAEETYRSYAARTLLFSGLFAIAGSIVGVYLIALLTVVLPISETAIASVLPAQLSFLATPMAFPDLTASQLFVLLFASSATLGVGSGLLTYQLRWWNLQYIADLRARRIDESLARTVAFIFALSRSGMAFPEVLRRLTKNREVYGEAAEEFGVVVKEIDLFGADMLSAIERIGAQTPSQEFDDFAENLVNVLQSGRSVSTFLQNQYERFQEDAEARQERFLELLGALAEGYVSVLVVGPLLFITILVIVGVMAVADTLDALRAMVYVIVPLGNVAFIIYLDSVTGDSKPHRAKTELREQSSSSAVESSAGVTDGGTATASTSIANVERLQAYNRFRSVRRYASQPLRTLLKRPAVLLYLTVPLATVVTLARILPYFADGIPPLAAVDDLFVQATLFVVGTFAIAQEIHKRRIEAIEAAIPDFLDRLAGVNEAGMTVIEGLRRVSTGDLGALDEEVERLWADVEWTGDATGALHRFQTRLRTVTVTRVVTLLTNAMNASGDLGPVLRIAADDAQETRRLKQSRRQEMLVYLVIVYLSFVVFLVIIAALNAILIPSIPTAPELSTGPGAPGPSLPIGNPGDVNVGAYELLFFHTAVVQGLFSGLVAGQMGEEDIKNGAKHAAVLAALAYVVFLVLP